MKQLATNLAALKAGGKASLAARFLRSKFNRMSLM